ncbi:MAG: TMEM175 family protein [Mucilaginibacter sp.]
MLHKDLKKEFQVERIAFFSDAVFAIAITLLIIEVKVPEIHGEHMSSEAIREALFQLIPKFIGFLVGFFVIGLYWVNHHQLFKHVVHYNSKLVWANLFLLFSIVIMPFSSALYSEYIFSIIPLGIYVINVSLTGLMHARLWFIVGNPKNKLSIGLENVHLVNYYKTRALVGPLVFLFAFAMGFIWIPGAYMSPCLIFVCMVIIKKYYHKHHPEIFNKHV